MTDAQRDENFVTAALGVSSDDGVTTLPLQVDPITGRLLADIPTGVGTVTSVSVVTANGFAGSVATATTTPAITLSTTLNTPVLAGNGTALIAATTTGTGSTVVLATSPTLVTPILGTPTSGNLSNCTAFPVAQLSGLGTGVATALAINVGSAGAFVTFNGALGTPSSGTLTNATGLPISTGVSGLGTGVATALAVNTGSTGAVVLFNGALGTPSSGTLTNATGLPIIAGTTGTLSVARGGTNLTGISALSIWVANSANTLVELTPGAGNSIRINASGTAWEAYTPGAGGSSITIGTTTITSGTTTRILYNNAGVVGEYTLTGTGTVVAMQTAPSFLTSITTPSVLASSNDSGALGASGTAFSDLFLASGAVINFAAGNSVLTHSSGVLEVTTGDLRVTTAGTNSASVVTVGGTQTLTNKTLTAPKFASGGFIADANGNELVIFTTTASAVNEITIANTATGANPTITASGGDTNIGIDLVMKGTGTFNLRGNATQAAELRLYEDTDAGTNYSAFKVGTQAGNITYTLPTALGSAGAVLTDAAGDGVLSWAAVGSGGFWAQLDKVTLGASSQTLNSATFSAKQNLEVIVKILLTGTVSEIEMTFNSDTGANYSDARLMNGGSAGPTDGVNSITVSDFPATDTYVLMRMTIMNIQSFNKLVYIDYLESTTTTMGQRGQYLGVWHNTANQITSIQLNTGSSTNKFNTGTILQVIGAD